jgi:hypothetical protein
LNIALGLELSGFDHSPAGRAAFHEYILAHRKDPKDPTISADKLTRILSNEANKGLFIDSILRTNTLFLQRYDSGLRLTSGRK